MATDWNGGVAPGTIGLTWFPNQIGGTPSSQSRGIAQTFTSTATESIANVWVGFDQRSASGYWCLDVFEAGDEVPGAVTQSAFVPTADEVNSANLWQNSAGNSTNLWSYIDNGVVSPTTYITYAGSYTQKGTYAFNIGTGAWGAGRRVLNMTFTFSAAAIAQAVGRLQVIYRGSATNYVLGSVSLTSSVETFSFAVGELNPDTGLPWSQADIVALASTAGFGWKALSGATTQMQVYDASVQINWVTENRAAYSVLSLGTLAQVDGPSWATFPILWSKANATDYTVLVRPVSPFGVTGGAFPAGQGSPRTLDSGSPLPTGLVAYRPLLDQSGAVVAMGDAETFAFSMAFDVNASATDSADGMPYMGYGTPALPGVGQTVDGATAVTYELLKFDLIFEESNVSDVEWSIATTGAVVLDSGTISQDEVEAAFVEVVEVSDGSAAGTYMKFGPFNVSCSVTLAPATTYRLNVTGSGGALAAVALLTTSDASPNSHGSPATYGGTTLNYNTVGDRDATVTLSTIPDPVESFSFSYDWYDTANQGCNPTRIPYWVLEWAPTILGADFDHYLIERSVDSGATWQTIGHITTEAVDQYQDKEAPFATPTTYRISVIRAGDLIASDYTTTTEQTLPEPDCVYYLSSNLSNVQLAYNAGDRTRWQFPSSDEVQIAPRAGADYQQALVNTEWRGDTFEVDLTVWAPANRAALPSPGEGRWTFDPIIDLTRQPLPYICVRDRTGRVWYANVNVTDAQADNGGAVPVDVATAVITEVTATPAVVDVQGPSIYDNFTRPNNVSDLGDAVTGQTWVQVAFAGGVLGIIDDSAYASTFDPAALFGLITDTPISDGFVQAEFSNLDGQIQQCGLLFGGDPAGTGGYSLTPRGLSFPDSWELLLSYGGLTILDQMDGPTTTPERVTIRIEYDTEIRIYFNNTLASTVVRPATPDTWTAVGFITRNDRNRVNEYYASTGSPYQPYLYVP